MKYSAALYKDAFLSLWDTLPEKDKKNLPTRFLSVLKKHGDIKYAKTILELINKELALRDNGKVVRLEFARTPSETMLKMVAGFLSRKDFVKTVINPSLGAGVRIVINEEQELDYSLEYKLKQMFTYKGTH